MSLSDMLNRALENWLLSRNVTNASAPFVRSALNGPDGALTVDPTGALTAIDFVHHEVHEGDTYRTWFVQPHGSGLADNASIDVVFTTTSRVPHIVFEIGFGGDCEFLIYRSPGFDADGTPFTPHNLNDTVSNTSTVSVSINPTVNSAGTLIDHEFIAGGSGGNSQGGAIRRGSEDNWRLNTSYLVRLTNRAGQAKQFGFEAQWYEEEQLTP